MRQGRRNPAFLRVLSGIWTCYGAATSRVFAIYEPFQVGGGGFVVRCISMNKKGKITTKHQPEALTKCGY
ncbi:ubiquitin--protein ligase [Escherichia coli]|nr:ubiquitin--protein ligase [Escherichia coli]